MITIEKTQNNKFTTVEIGNLKLYFSYETIIGFKTGTRTTAIKNYWSNTTGRHLNTFSDKSERLERPDFNQALETTLKEHNLN